MDDTPEGTIERAAYALWLLTSDDGVTTAQVAIALGISRQGAYYLLSALSRSHVWPLTHDGERWLLLRSSKDS